MVGDFKQCPNGHYYQGDKCPYCGTKSVISVGSASDNDCIISNPDIDSHHCKIEYVGYDKYRIVDLGTASGTFVNGKRVDGSSTLEPYDEVKVGKENVVQWRHYFYSVSTNRYSDGLSGTILFSDNSEKKASPKNDLPENDTIDKITTRKLVGWLVTYSFDPMGVDFRLYEGRNIIGRDMDCNITINDNMVSAKHAVLLYRKGKYSITDSQSSWGTFVNGENIDLVPRYLEDGDIIRVGKTEFEFHSIGKIKINK